MMKKYLLVGVAGIGLPLVLSACGGDNSSSGGTWQSAQTAAVLSAVSNSVSQVNQTKVNEIQSHAVVSHSPNSSIHFTSNCVGGGTATITGNMTVSTTGTSPDTTSTMTYSYQLIFNQCASTGSDGQTYLLAGTGISVAGSSVWTMTGTFQDLNSSSNDNFTITGNVDVSGAASLSCDIDLNTQVSSADVEGVFTATGSYNGTVCGQPENGSESENVTVSTH